MSAKGRSTRRGWPLHLAETDDGAGERTPQFSQNKAGGGLALLTFFRL